MSVAASGIIPVYVGTYTHRESVGVYVYTLDLQSGKLEYHSELADIEQPSFLGLSPDQRHLYVINELVPNGQITACSIHESSGKLERFECPEHRRFESMLRRSASQRPFRPGIQLPLRYPGGAADRVGWQPRSGD